jgi:hypothetical protein
MGSAGNFGRKAEPPAAVIAALLLLEHAEAEAMFRPQMAAQFAVHKAQSAEETTAGKFAAQFEAVRASFRLLICKRIFPP